MPSRTRRGSKPRGVRTNATCARAPRAPPPPLPIVAPGAPAGSPATAAPAAEAPGAACPRAKRPAPPRANPPAAPPAPPRPAPTPPVAPPPPRHARARADSGRPAPQRPARAAPWRWICARSESASRPSAAATVGSSRTVRTASSGTASTPERSSIEIVTSPFMPGSSRPFSLLIAIRTGNIVTACWITAWGWILTTSPWNGRLGKASTVKVAVCPGLTLPMSVSPTSACIWTRLRSAILSRVVPPLAEEGADAMTRPLVTSCSMTVPAEGARTVASWSAWRAISRSEWARASEDCALAKASTALSCWSAVSTSWLNSSSARFFAAPVISTSAWAALSAASDWLYWFCTVTASIWASRSPALTTEPSSTGMLRICPDALDLISTTSTGSTVPVASTVCAMSRVVNASEAITTAGARGVLKCPMANQAPTTTAATSTSIAVRLSSPPRFTRLYLRRRPSRASFGSDASQTSPHQCLELRPRHTPVVARLDEIVPRLVERRLRGQHVEQRGDADRVLLLLLAQVLGGRLDRRALGGDALLRGVELAQRLGEALERREPRVAQRRLGVVLGHPGLGEPGLVLELREQRHREREAQRARIGRQVVAPQRERVAGAVAAPRIARGHRRQVGAPGDARRGPRGVQ